MRNLGPFDLQNCMLKGIAGIEAGSRSRQDTAPSKLRFSSLNLGPLWAAKSSPRATGSADCRGMKQKTLRAQLDF